MMRESSAVASANVAIAGTEQLEGAGGVVAEIGVAAGRHTRFEARVLC